jgi:hypothetical protein
VASDIMIEAPGVGAGLALRVRNSQFFRGVTPGLYLFVGQATPGIPTKKNPNDPGMCGIPLVFTAELMLSGYLRFSA